MDTLRGLKPSENIADYLEKFDRLNLGNSAIGSKQALERFAKVISVGSSQEQIDQSLQELLSQITASIFLYASAEPDHSSVDQFIESSTLLISWISTLYANLIQSHRFKMYLQVYSANPGEFSVDNYKKFLTNLYHTALNCPPVKVANVYPKTELGVGKLRPEQPIEIPVIPKNPPSTLAGLSSLFDGLELPEHADKTKPDAPVIEEITTVSNVSASLAMLTEKKPLEGTTGNIQTAAAEPTKPVDLKKDPTDFSDLFDSEDEADRTNPRIDIAALSITTLKLSQSRAEAARLAKATEEAEAAAQAAAKAAEALAEEAARKAKAIPFTSEGNKILGLPVYTAENPAPQSKSSLPVLVKSPLTTSSSPTTNDRRIQVRNPESEEITKVTRIPRPTPGKISAKARKMMLIAGLGLTTAGSVGLVTLSLRKDSNLAASQAPSTAPSTSDSSQLAEKPVLPPQKSIETPVEPKYESGIYKVDSNHPKFKKYLDDIKQASGLVALIKDFAGQTSIQYTQNPAKFAELKKAGKAILTGNEDEMDLRIAIAEKLVETALAQRIDNSFVKNYFENQKRGIANFKKTKVWAALDKGYGVDKFFESIQVPQKYLSSPNIIGYAPDIDPIMNPDLKRVASGAPNFYKILLQVGKEMQEERDPTKVIPYRDFESIKSGTCDRIKAKGKILKTPDERSGIAFMHKAWCSPTANPYNDLNKSLMHVVEITEQPAPTVDKTPGTKPPMPAGPIHNSIHLNRVNLLDAPNAPTPTGLKIPANPTKEPAAVLPKPKVGLVAPDTTASKYAEVKSSAITETEQPVYFSRTINNIKSWFGFGNKEVVKTAKVTTKTASTEPLFSKKDLPMKSWKQTIKEFFWS